MDEITLLLIDGEPSLIRGLRMRLELEPDFRVVGELRRTDDVENQAKALAPDVVVLDADLPDQSRPALALVRLLARAHAVVVLSLRDSREAAIDTLEAGADAFVPKHEPSASLIAAIRSAAAARRTRVGTEGDVMT